jgi:hypothetical protein
MVWRPAGGADAKPISVGHGFSSNGVAQARNGAASPLSAGPLGGVQSIPDKNM